MLYVRRHTYVFTSLFCSLIFALGSGCGVRFKNSDLIDLVSNITSGSSSSSSSGSGSGDGFINAQANVMLVNTANNSLYLGGAFTSYQPYKAPEISALDTTNGTPQIDFLSGFSGGEVTAILINGGYAYVGGYFTAYQGQTAQGLAKVDLVTTNLDTTFTQATGLDAGVFALVINGTSLYVAGEFSTYRGANAGGIAKINTTTGNLDAVFTQAVMFDGPASALAISGTSIYVGGTFTDYRGTTVENLVKLDLTTGVLDTTFSQITGPDNYVLSLYASGTSLYVGGGFTNYRGSTAVRLAKVDLSSGNLDTTFTQATGVTGGDVYALSSDGTSLYAGGSFNLYRGSAAIRLMKVDLTNGNLDTTFTQVTGLDSNVYSIVTDGTDLYVGGAFTSYRGTAIGRIMKVDFVNGDIDTTFTNNRGYNADVRMLYYDTGRIYAGGQFNFYSGITTSYLAKVDLTTGTLDTTFTQSTGPSGLINALATDGSSLYVGGNISTYRGTAVQNLIKVDLNTGVLDTTFSQATGPNMPVYTISLNGTSVYAGGMFTTYRGTAAVRFAKVDSTTGNLDTVFTQVTGFAASTVLSSYVLGTSIYVGGNFTTYRGATALYLAKLDLTSGNLDTTFTQATGLNSQVNSIQSNGTDIYIGGSFATYRGSPAQGVAKLETINGNLDTTFTQVTGLAGGFSAAQTILVHGGSLYIGGNYTTYRGTAAQRLAKVDLTTGNLDTTFTQVNGFAENVVTSLAVDGSILFTSGTYSNYRSVFLPYFLMLDTANGNESNWW